MGEWQYVLRKNRQYTGNIPADKIFTPAGTIHKHIYVSILNWISNMWYATISDIENQYFQIYN